MNSARDPSRFGQCQFGFCRFGTFTSQWEQMFKATNLFKDYTRRKHFLLQRDTVTGWYQYEWVESTVKGILYEQGSRVPSFAVGVVMQVDALLFCLAGFRTGDQVYDVDWKKTYSIVSKEEHRAPNKGGFAFRVCHLHLLELYKEDM